MTHPPSQLLKAVAHTLEIMATEVDEFGAELAADPDLASRHLTILQGVDRWSQELVQLAKVIAADDPIAAAEMVTLRELREQLRKAGAD